MKRSRFLSSYRTRRTIADMGSSFLVVNTMVGWESRCLEQGVVPKRRPPTFTNNWIRGSRSLIRSMTHDPPHPPWFEIEICHCRSFHFWQLIWNPISPRIHFDLKSSFTTADLSGPFVTLAVHSLSNVSVYSHKVRQFNTYFFFFQTTPLHQITGPKMSFPPMDYTSLCSPEELGRAFKHESVPSIEEHTSCKFILNKLLRFELTSFRWAITKGNEEQIY